MIPLLSASEALTVTGTARETLPFLSIERFANDVEDVPPSVAAPAPVNDTRPVLPVNVPLFVQFPFTLSVPPASVNVAPDSMVTFFASLVVEESTLGCASTHVWFAGMMTSIAFVGTALATV
jgi:hypothetical protein